MKSSQLRLHNEILFQIKQQHKAPPSFVWYPSSGPHVIPEGVTHVIPEGAHQVVDAIIRSSDVSALRQSLLLILSVSQ